MTSRHAVVIDGSSAGLCAAGSLARFFNRVTLIERDTRRRRFWPRPEPRPRHPYDVLLARGRRELERLFPGFDGRMRARGALEIDLGRDFSALGRCGAMLREPTGMTVLVADSALVEATLREGPRRHPNVTIVGGAEVRRLRLDPEGDQRVTGVVMRRRGRDRELEADFVVDAGGRSSRAPEWLRGLGVTPPEETRVDGCGGTATRWFEAPAGFGIRRWKGLWIDPRPPAGKLGAALVPVEDRRFAVTIFAVAGQRPPGDEAGFSAALKALDAPALCWAVGSARPISRVSVSHATESRIRHYEWCWTLPRSFVALGDAACAPNPLYGLEATCAAASAGILVDELAAWGPGDPLLSFRFFAAQSHFLRGVWNLATAADFRLPQTGGRRPVFASVRARYLRALVRASGRDPVVRRRVSEAIHLLAPTSALYSVPMLGRVVRGALRHHLERGLAGPVGLASPDATLPTSGAVTGGALTGPA